MEKIEVPLHWLKGLAQKTKTFNKAYYPHKHTHFSFELFYLLEYCELAEEILKK